MMSFFFFWFTNKQLILTKGWGHQQNNAYHTSHKEQPWSERSESQTRFGQETRTERESIHMNRRTLRGKRSGRRHERDGMWQVERGRDCETGGWTRGTSGERSRGACGGGRPEGGPTSWCNRRG